MPRHRVHLRLDVLDQRGAAELDVASDLGDHPPQALHADEVGEEPDRAKLVAQSPALEVRHALLGDVGLPPVVTKRQDRGEVLERLADSLERDLGAGELQLEPEVDAEVLPANEAQSALRPASVPAKTTGQAPIARVKRRRQQAAREAREVEGEDDLILMGMVKDVTGRFTERYMAGMLGVIQSINVGPDGRPLGPDQAILRIGPMETLKHPARAAQ